MKIITIGICRMENEINEIYGEEYLSYLEKRSAIRKFIRKFYLNDIRGYCIGRTIDLGCGIGELLKILPLGSIGLEVNDFAVKFCNLQGLKVLHYSPEVDDYKFSMIEQGQFTTLTMNHVLEHLEEPSSVINKIFSSCYDKGFQRIIFTVPGAKGFKSDETHQTFIDIEFLRKFKVLENKYFQMQRLKYFPFNSQLASRYFTHNELRLVFDRKI